MEGIPSTAHEADNFIRTIEGEEKKGKITIKHNN